MARMALFLLMALVLGSSAAKSDAKSDLKACESEATKLKSEATKLKSQLEAAQAEIAALKKTQSAADEEVPYVSTKFIVDSLGSVMGQGSLNVDLAPYYTAADASYGAIQKASSQATEMASQGSAAAKTAFSNAAEMAQDLHGKHVSQHTREYYDTAMKTYSTHVAPHVTMARKVYDQNGAAYVDMATAGISTGVGAAMEGHKLLSPKLQELWEQGTKSLLGASGGAVGDKLALLTQPRTITVLGRSRTFRHGIMDILLAVVQGACVFYVAVQLLWKLFLKTLVWNIGVHFFGKTVCINLTFKLVKVSFKLTQIILRILYTLVFTVLGLLLTCLVLPIGIGGGLGVGLLHVIEKNAAVGLSTGQRLGAGIGAGTLVYWLFSYVCCGRCCCRSGKKKSAEAKPQKNGAKQPASAKGAPAKTTAQAAKGTNKKK